MKRFFTTGEAADLLGISRATVARKYDRGILTGKKNPITGERLISFESIADFMKDYNLDAPDSSLGIRKVFIVSSDKRIVACIQEAIGSDPRFDIEILTHGSDALVKSSTESAKILIIDSSLPDIPGSEVVKSLRRMKVNEEMKILLCSDTLNDRQLLNERADNFIGKDNLDRELIREKIYDLINIKRDDGKIDHTFNHGRRWPRLELDLPARIWNPSSNIQEQSNQDVSILKDISYGGALLSQINFINEINPFKKFRLRIEKKGGPLENLEATSRIVRFVHTKSLLVGVEFVDISDENRKKILKLPR